MKTAENFFKWAFDTRGKTVIALNNGEDISKEKMFLSFCSHDPAFVSNGPAGLNASIKGIGFLPKPEYLEETLEAYLKHIDTFDPEDKSYSKRGLELLVKYMYGPEARERIDFTCIGSLEMAKKHSYANYKANPEAFKGHVGDVSNIIRVAVTGRTKSPDLYSIMKTIGKERVLNRISAYKGAIS